MSNRWLKMGVELEGSWSTSRHDLIAKCRGSEAKGDASVSGLVGEMGEITTRPHTDLEALCKDIDILHPDYTNSTCGFHIHTSHSPMDYSSLTTQEFYAVFRSGWDTWAKGAKDGMSIDEWRNWKERYSNRVSYCKDEFIPLLQLDPVGGRETRYTQLNFSAYKKYKTVENRLLPMFQNKALSISAVRAWSGMLNAFLKEYTFPSIEIEDSLTLVGEGVEETVNYKAVSLKEEETNFPTLKTKKVRTGEDIYYYMGDDINPLMYPWANGKPVRREP